ncbi:DUF742 domain-containing protein [Streptomyces sp. RB6PN25]|uniref:DUF742 domain-containing protein n=1 Tax=Streptomyces humicola TaxID=2953240 RepID=A0ABT1PQN9_9ACTN|nr:DUF742 domain-containing protein [Streptomyces humicola]MCQ4079448.1 DUF742 domain-containing protein [Streptomyces humicola]
MNTDDADHRTGSATHETHWYEDDSEPLVRPYTVTRGRTRPAREHEFDLMATVAPVSGVHPPTALDHARSSLLESVGRRPRPVAELAADAGLPVGALRVLLGDLLDAGLVTIESSASTARGPDAALLREVIDGLRRL